MASLLRSIKCFGGLVKKGTSARVPVEKIVKCEPGYYNAEHPSCVASLPLSKKKAANSAMVKKMAKLICIFWLLFSFFDCFDGSDATPLVDMMNEKEKTCQALVGMVTDYSDVMCNALEEAGGTDLIRSRLSNFISRAAASSYAELLTYLPWDTPAGLPAANGVRAIVEDFIGFSDFGPVELATRAYVEARGE